MTSIFETVTIEQFKEYYARDFSFLPFFNPLKTYWSGDIVYWTDENFYQSLTDNNNTTPNDTENWKKIKGSINDYITDADIMKAFAQALANANESFGRNCQEKIMLFLHLWAFYLVVDIQNASGGVNSSYAGLVASKSVDGVSESYNFPTWLMNSPLYSLYSSNGYGLKYLSLIMPYLACTVIFSRGGSTCG